MLVAAFLLVQSVVGLELPDYDVDALCRIPERGLSKRYKPEIDACVNSEQTHYDMLKLEWGQLSDREKTYYLEHPPVPGSNYKYTMLEMYVSAFLDRKRREAPTPAFRR